MKEIKLSKRLKVIADFVRPDALVADIGTDHGYIPVYLVQNKIARTVIASDINIGPIESARSAAVKYGVSDNIKFVCAPGLDGIKEGEIDTAIIAGMGGETIIGILDAAPWAHARGVRLILQPQSKESELIKWLFDSRYEILDGKLVEDSGKLYMVMVAKAAQRRSAQTSKRNSIEDIFLQNKDPLLPEYLNERILKLRRVIAGMRQAKNTDICEISYVETELSKLCKLKGETEKWLK